jgi:hypothetical protein
MNDIHWFVWIYMYLAGALFTAILDRLTKFSPDKIAGIAVMAMWPVELVLVIIILPLYAISVLADWIVNRVKY